MKIREGFISNSSSASFIVNVNSKQDLFLRPLFNWGSDIDISVMGLKQKIKEDIKFFEGICKENREKIKELKKKPKKERMCGHEKKLDMLDFQKGDLKLHKSQVSSRKKTLESISKFPDNIYEASDKDKLDFLKDLLAYHHCHFIKLGKNKFKISGWVSMFNSYSDVPEILQKIIMCLSFNHVDITCDIDSDD